MRLVTKLVLATVSIFIALAIVISIVTTRYINTNTINDEHHQAVASMLGVVFLTMIVSIFVFTFIARGANVPVEKLTTLNNELELSNKNHIDMLGFVSHELKNPLGSAVMALHTVKDGHLGDLNAKQLKALGSVAESLDYFKELIESYLDLSRLEKGEYVVQKQNISLKNAVIDPVLKQFAEELKSHNISVDITVHDDTKVDADPDLLRIVYDNLISNAIKYGKEDGTIRIREKIADEKLFLSVYNEGVGIAKENMSLLFKKFSRIHLAEHAGKRGTGLGLYFCREILKKHGGEIWAESEPGKWVEFNFKIG